MLVNPTHKICSNAKRGGISIDLACPDQKPRTSKLPESDLIEIDAIAEMLERCGIDPMRRYIPSRIVEYASRIGMFPGCCLLRGQDYIFSEDGRPFALEANTHPGPPGSGMWMDILGLKHNGMTTQEITKEEIGIAAKTIANCIPKLEWIND